MNFKKLAEQKIDELSGKTSRNVPSKNVESDSIDLVLEGLDEELSLVENNEETFEFDLDEDELEFSSEQSKKEQVQNLFDGYLGEKSETPNPLEYGPNATYRNLREGIVYKKGPDNLWETFVKDGQNGRAGQAAPGGGCGVSEVNSIVNNAISIVVSAVSNITSNRYGVPVRYLDRPVRIATFGDSRANFLIQHTSAYNLENFYVPFVSGSSISVFYDNTKIYIRNVGKFLPVANGGFSGQTTSQMLGRSASAWNVYRKAVQDIINKKPDVVLFRGNINDLSLNITSASTESDILSYFNQYKILVECVTNAGIPVIDTGALGWRYASSASSFTSNDIAVQTAILKINQLIDQESITNKLWKRIDTENIITSSATFLDNTTLDGLHMNINGGRLLAEIEKKELDSMFFVSPDYSKIIYDTVKDYATASFSATAPSNYQCLLTNSSILSSSIKINKWDMVYYTSSNTNNIQININNLRSGIVSGLTSGDNFLIYVKIEIKDSSGKYVSAFGYSKRFRPYSTDNLSSIVYEDSLPSVNGNLEIMSLNAMPIDGASLGTSTQYYTMLQNLPADTYNITIYPAKFVKYIPLN